MKIPRNTKSYITAVLLISACVFVCFEQKSYAQDSGPIGILSGLVVDADYGGSVLNAQIMVVENSMTVKSNMDGRYYFPSIPSGTYTILVTAPYYKSTQVEEVEIIGGQVVKIDIPMRNDSSDVFELASLSVKAETLQNSDLGLLQKRQKASTVSDAIGSESFSRLGLGDAADAMAKLPGVSIIDGKYVVVRGLSDRYNNTTLNGSSVPSADPDRKAVQLDQFPSGLIDTITTTKSFTPDKSGEFTGGNIDIQTKSFPDRFFIHFSGGMEYNENTTGESVLTYAGGSDDWLGKDDGTRALPEIAKNTDNLSSKASVEVRDEVINAFSKTMSPTRREAPINRKFALSVGDNLDFFGKRFGYVASLTYDRSFSHEEGSPDIRYRVLRDPGLQEWTIRPHYEMSNSETSDEVNIGLLLNGALQLSENHEIGLKNFYNQSGNDVAKLAVGEVNDSESLYLRENRLHFTERSISSNQLYGKHAFEGLKNTKVEWDVSRSSSTQDEPDFRLFFDSTDIGDQNDPDARWYFPTGLNNRRLFRELSEDSNEFGLDVAVPLTEGGSHDRYVKVGYRKISSNREYNETGFGFGSDFRGAFASYNGDPESYLTEETAGFNSDGKLVRVMNNGSAFVPGYNGEREVTAYYAMADIPLTKKLRIVGGARNEATMIKVSSFTSTGDPLVGGDASIDEDQWLPAATAIWNLAESHNLRFATSKTIARPNYRELSPVATFTSIGAFFVAGNPDLEMTTIRNYDLRWEWFPRTNELVAISAFYKDLSNPIEQTYNMAGRRTWRNVDSGEVKGIELEARKKIELFSGEYTALTVGGNISMIESEVNRTAEEISSKSHFDPNLTTVRDLQGQSSLLANVDATWEHYRKGTQLTLTYNHTGDRLYEVTLAQLPNALEVPGDSLDLIVSQKISNRWKLKFKASDLLDSANDRLYEFLGEDYIYSSSRSGRSYSLSLSYSYD